MSVVAIYFVTGYFIPTTTPIVSLKVSPFLHLILKGFWL